MYFLHNIIDGLSLKFRGSSGTELIIWNSHLTGCPAFYPAILQGGGWRGVSKTELSVKNKNPEGPAYLRLAHPMPGFPPLPCHPVSWATPKEYAPYSAAAPARMARRPVSTSNYMPQGASELLLVEQMRGSRKRWARGARGAWSLPEPPTRGSSIIVPLYHDRVWLSL